MDKRDRPKGQERLLSQQKRSCGPLKVNKLYMRSGSLEPWGEGSFREEETVMGTKNLRGGHGQELVGLGRQVTRVTEIVGGEEVEATLG